MTDDEKPFKPGNQARAEDFLQVFKRGIQFTEELLAENERLRIRLIRLEEENRKLARETMDPGSYEDLLAQMKILEEERMSLMERFRSVEDESRDFKERYREIEEENNRLANLYIASYQLHSTLELKEVIRISFEIIINLVGSMDFALYIANDENQMVPVRSQGRALASLPLVTAGQGVAGRAVQDGVLYVSGGDLNQTSLTEPKACVPLRVGNRLLGMIVVFGFLAHKACVTELDRELFKLLGGHAAVAIYSARLDSEAGSVSHDASSYLRLLNS